MTIEQFHKELKNNESKFVINTDKLYSIEAYLKSILPNGIEIYSTKVVDNLSKKSMPVLLELTKDEEGEIHFISIFTCDDIRIKDKNDFKGANFNLIPNTESRIDFENRPLYFELSDLQSIGEISRFDKLSIIKANNDQEEILRVMHTIKEKALNRFKESVVGYDEQVNKLLEMQRDEQRIDNDFEKVLKKIK